MPGTLGYSFREGNRSEYLAQFILSALGTCVPVLRQEDIGTDFHCTVAKRKGQVLTFGSPYIVQIKSDSEDKIVYGWHAASDGKPAKWKKAELEWLFGQENPLLIGVVDKGALSLSLYSTTAVWMAFYQQRYPGQLILVPNEPSSPTDHVPGPEKSPGVGWAEGTGDNQSWKVRLGPPIVSITAHDVQEPERLLKFRQIIEFAVATDQANLWYRGLGVPYLNWILTADTNNPDHFTRERATAFYHFATGNPANTEIQLATAAPIIASLILHYAIQQQPALVLAFKDSYSLIKNYLHSTMQQAIEAKFTECSAAQANATSSGSQNTQ